MNKPRRSTAKILIIMAWILPFLLILPSLLNLYGMHGLECKTRKCTILIDEKGRDHKLIVGSVTFVSAAILLIGFNLAIFAKLRVRQKKICLYVYIHILGVCGYSCYIRLIALILMYFKICSTFL